MSIISYIKETKAELTHVVWPKPRTALALTMLVIGLSIATALFLGLFDYIFSLIIQKFVL